MTLDTPQPPSTPQSCLARMAPEEILTEQGRKSPAGLVVSLLDRALLHVRTIEQTIERGETDECFLAIRMASEVLMALHLNLMPESSSVWAAHFGELYRLMLVHVMRMQGEQSPTQAKKLRQSLQILRETWKSLEKHKGAREEDWNQRLFDRISKMQERLREGLETETQNPSPVVTRHV